MSSDADRRPEGDARVLEERHAGDRRRALVERREVGCHGRDARVDARAVHSLHEAERDDRGDGVDEQEAERRHHEERQAHVEERLSPADVDAPPDDRPGQHGGDRERADGEAHGRLGAAELVLHEQLDAGEEHPDGRELAERHRVDQLQDLPARAAVGAGSTVYVLAMADTLDIDAMIKRFQERAKAVKDRALPPVAGAERQHFLDQAKQDFMDYAIIGDAEASLDDGILTSGSTSGRSSSRVGRPRC